MIKEYKWIECPDCEYKSEDYLDDFSYLRFTKEAFCPECGLHFEVGDPQ